MQSGIVYHYMDSLSSLPSYPPLRRDGYVFHLPVREVTGDDHPLDGHIQIYGVVGDISRRDVHNGRQSMCSWHPAH